MAEMFKKLTKEELVKLIERTTLSVQNEVQTTPQ